MRCICRSFAIFNLVQKWEETHKINVIFLSFSVNIHFAIGKLRGATFSFLTLMFRSKHFRVPTKKLLKKISKKKTKAGHLIIFMRLLEWIE